MAESEAEASIDMGNEVVGISQDISAIEDEIERERERIRLEEERRRREAELARLAELERQRQEDLARLAEQAGVDEVQAEGTITVRLYHCMMGNVVKPWDPSYPYEDLTRGEIWTPVNPKWAMPEGEMERMATLANEHLTPFFLRESGGRAVVKFEAGGEVLGRYPEPVATLEDIALGGNTPGETPDKCKNRVLRASGGPIYDEEALVSKWHWITLVRDTILFPGGHAGLAISGLGRDSGGRDYSVQGPVYVAYRDEPSFLEAGGEPFPLFTVAHEVAHMLWGMEHVNEVTCDHPGSLLNAGSSTACSGVINSDDVLGFHYIDCPNRERAGWEC